MRTATLQFPGPLTSKKCWVGAYGGHFDVVVVFHTEPVKTATWWDSELFDYNHLIEPNKDRVAGVFCRHEFKDWFGVDIKPAGTFIKSVEEMIIVTYWLGGTIIGLNNNYD